MLETFIFTVLIECSIAAPDINRIGKGVKTCRLFEPGKGNSFILLCESFRIRAHIDCIAEVAQSVTSPDQYAFFRDEIRFASAVVIDQLIVNRERFTVAGAVGCMLSVMGQIVIQYFIPGVWHIRAGGIELQILYSVTAPNWQLHY